MPLLAVQILTSYSKIQVRQVMLLMNYNVSLGNRILPVPYLNDPGWDLWIMFYESISMVTQE
jgi:hypothetical protein